MLNKLAACLLLAAAMPAAGADDFRSETRLAMGEEEFRRTHEQFARQGLRLVDLTVSESRGKPVIGAIWHRYPGMPEATPELIREQLANVFLKLDESGLRTTGQRLGAAGSMVEVVDAYESGGKTWFAAAFAPARQPTMQTVGAFLDAGQMAGMRADAHKQNNDFARIECYFDGGEMKNFPAFVARGVTEIEVQHFPSTLSVSATGVRMHLQGMAPLSISVCGQGEGRRWLVAWDKSRDRELVFTDRGEKIREKLGQGAQAMDLDSDENDVGEVFYYAVMTLPLKKVDYNEYKNWGK
jgi:hypothetical protein